MNSWLLEQQISYEDAQYILYISEVWITTSDR